MMNDDDDELGAISKDHKMQEGLHYKENHILFRN